MALLMMGAEKIRRLLRLFFVFLSAWFLCMAEACILMDAAYAQMIG
jgi:hypothetical protein